MWFVYEHLCRRHAPIGIGGHRGEKRTRIEIFVRTTATEALDRRVEPIEQRFDGGLFVAKVSDKGNSVSLGHAALSEPS